MSPDESNRATTSLLGFTEDRLRERLGKCGAEPFRATQILEWVYRRQVRSFEKMTNLPKSLRDALAKKFCVEESVLVAQQTASDGTRKLLLRWADGESTECVLIPDGRRRTACVSTQVGCPVGCRFCASGIDGLQRDLTASQIVEQALRICDLCTTEAPLSNVVFMGLGEPLANYDHTVAACRIINAAWGLNIAARKMTLSTVGLPRQMRRLADEGMQITLALSLHAATDELRRRLIPWAGGSKIAKLMEAAHYFFERTGREITIEYVLLGGVNDGPQEAEQLAEVCAGARANVNLIPYNPVAGLAFQRPEPERTRRFQEILCARGVNVHLRKSRGLEIAGACGQLRLLAGGKHDSA